MFIKFLSLFSLFIFSLSASAAVNPIPKNLGKTDREMTVGALGFGSASKLLSSPYPMGGYSGVELSVSSEYIPMADVAALGGKSSSRSDLNYFNVTVGKGLFYNVDFLIQFVAMPQDQA